MEIGKIIAELRESRGLSMRKLAEKSGISQSFISKIEAGEKQPTIDSLLKISTGLGISLIELLGGNRIAESLPPDLQDLLTSARNLTPVQLKSLNLFIKSMTEQSAIKDVYHPLRVEEPEPEPEPKPVYNERIAAHREDNPMDDLPEEALKRVEEIKEAYRQKHQKNNR